MMSAAALLTVAAGTVTGEGSVPGSVKAAESAVTPLAPIQGIRVAASDGRVTFSWSLSRQFSGDFRGVRLYRLLDGRQIRFNHPVEELVEDLGIRTSWTVSGLENGEQYGFILKGYDSGKKEFWSTLLYAYPGSDPRGAPRRPVSFYAAVGDGRVTLFWERNREANMAFYELQRKGPRDQEFKTVGRLPKLLLLKQITLLTPALYRDRSVTNGESYQYRLRALNMERKASPFTEPVTASPLPALPPCGKDIVLLVNSSADDGNHGGVNDSEEMARYYAARRGVPLSQILRLPLKRDIYAIDYARDIQRPLQQFLLSGNLAGRVTMLVPCFGMPTWSGGLALDSRLSDLFDRNISGTKMGSPNPYFDSNRHFDGTDGVYLVTRLDGPTLEIAKGLVDKALAASETVSAASGRVSLGGRATKEQGDLSIRKTAEFAQWLGLDVTFKDPGSYTEHELGPDVFWYFAWYHGYRDPVRERWPVGAVGAHLTSYSFSGIREPDPAKKSWVQGLLEKGITATFGSVVEPYQQGFTRAELFFSHFWSGDYTFAESFFMATPTVQWAMSAVGDPLFRLRKPPVGRGVTPPPAFGGETPPGRAP